MFNKTPSVLRQNDTSADGTLLVAEAIARRNALMQSLQKLVIYAEMLHPSDVELVYKNQKDKKKRDLTAGCLTEQICQTTDFQKNQRRQLLFQACWEPLRPDHITGSLRRYSSTCLWCTHRNVPQQVVERRTAGDGLDAETRGRIKGFSRLS